MASTDLLRNGAFLAVLLAGVACARREEVEEVSAARSAPAGRWESDLIHGLAAGLKRSDYEETYEFLRWRVRLQDAPWDITLRESPDCLHEDERCLNAEVRVREARPATPTGEGGACELPIYPIFEERIATLASFRSERDPRFHGLPGGVKSLFRKLKGMSERGERAPNAGAPRAASFGTWTAPVRVGIEELRTRAPSLSNAAWWIAGDKAVARAEPSAVYFLVRPLSGTYQIELEFAAAPAGPIFAFQSASEAVMPAVAPLLPEADRVPFQRGAAVCSALIDEARVYIGSIPNAKGRFDMVWDARRQAIASLSVLSGYSYGDHPMRLSRNHLLRHGNRRYVLRFSEDYCELVCLGARVERRVLADRTDPKRGEVSISTWTRPRDAR